MAMPIANIPEFKKEGAILKVSCKTGSKQLSKVAYPCDTIADLEADKQGTFFWEENTVITDPEYNPEPVKPSNGKQKLDLQRTMMYINWT